MEADKSFLEHELGRLINIEKERDELVVAFEDQKNKCHKCDNRTKNSVISSSHTEKVQENIESRSDICDNSITTKKILEPHIVKVHDEHKKF